MLMFPNVRKENDIEKKKTIQKILIEIQKTSENSGLDNANIIKRKK